METKIVTTQSIVWHDESFDMALHEKACRTWRDKGFRAVPSNWPGGFMEWRFRYIIVDGVSALMKPLPRWWDRALWKFYRWRHPITFNTGVRREPAAPAGELPEHTG